MALSSIGPDESYEEIEYVEDEEETEEREESVNRLLPAFKVFLDSYDRCDFTSISAEAQNAQSYLGAGCLQRSMCIMQFSHTLKISHFSLAGVRFPL